MMAIAPKRGPLPAEQAKKFVSVRDELLTVADL